MKKNYIKIGSFLKPQGTAGEIKVNIADEFLDDMLGGDHVFILLRGTYVPYFIESVREANHILVKLEEIDDPESAAVFSNKDIYLDEKNISNRVYADKKEKGQWMDYKIYNKEMLIGAITEIELLPHQIMALVDYNGKLVRIPLADQLISEINKSSQTIIMQLPEGLLDM